MSEPFYLWRAPVRILEPTVLSVCGTGTEMLVDLDTSTDILPNLLQLLMEVFAIS